MDGAPSRRMQFPTTGPENVFRTPRPPRGAMRRRDSLGAVGAGIADDLRRLKGYAIRAVSLLVEGDQIRPLAVDGHLGGDVAR